MSSNKGDFYALTVIIPTYNQANNIHIGLDSIPADPRIEIIVINDGSTDGTAEVVHDYMQKHKNKCINLVSFSDNRGVSSAVNAGLDRARGEYEVVLGSDGDFFYPGVIQKALDLWLPTNKDLIYFDIIDNTGHIRKLSPKTKVKYVGSVKFMKRSFVGETRCPLERRRAEDTVFSSQLFAKNPTEYYTHTIVKHYNYPREGSLTWNARHGVTDRFGHTPKDDNAN